MPCLVLAVLVAILPGLVLFSGCSKLEPETRAKAAIVDQLHDLQPNPLFINCTIEAIKNCGLAVDVYQGDEITVDFYHRLPSQ